MLKFTTGNEYTRISSFSTSTPCEECFISVLSPDRTTFPKALEKLTESYLVALGDRGLSDATAVFTRIFLSDIVNQKPELLRSPLYRQLQSSCACSVIEQKTVGSGPVALLSYHIGGTTGTIDKQMLTTGPEASRSDLVVTGENYSLLWTADYTDDEVFDGYRQTKNIFDALTTTIEGRRMTLLDNAVRTWVYVRDVDNHYKDMVRARREFFAMHDLTEKTRYLASTGILGLADAPEKIVSVDSLSIDGLTDGQIVRMEAPTHMSPTILYGVTFERGLRVRFGDRSHLHISGTASINNKGEVLHLGDAGAQARRMIENVRVLLEGQNASLDDLAYIIVYLRNAHDRHFVENVLAEEIRVKVPMVLVEAPVCRPTWLVELEGIAIIDDATEYPPFL